MTNTSSSRPEPPSPVFREEPRESTDGRRRR
jgi:hypothetical protein